MSKGKVFSISFPVKSSKELASRLGVSKSRTNRISAIIEKIVEPKTSPMTLSGKRKPKTHAIVKKRNPDTRHVVFKRTRSDTRIGTLRNTYGDDFASGFRSDAKLGTVLDRTGADSLSDLLKRHSSQNSPSGQRTNATAWKAAKAAR